MSKNHEIIQAHYRGSEAKDLATMMIAINEQTSWTEMAGFPCAGTYHGPDEIIQNVFQVLGSEWDGYDFQLERLLDAEDSIIGIGTYSGTFKKTGKSMTARVTHVWDLKNGKVTNFEQFTDTALVAKAMS